MRKIFTAFLLLCAALWGAGAQGFEADSLQVSSEPPLINDYTLIGVNYGVSIATMYYSPARHNRAFVISPNYVSVTFTKFSKMFDKLPYFALVVGVAHGYEGFAFEKDPETGLSQDVDGAEQAKIEVFEIPALAQIHADFYPGKLMANVGVYGGWRKSISRSGPRLDPDYTDAFRPYEHQFVYGLQGGIGFGLMLDPVEIHLNALIRWSWSSLYDPDYASPYYYRYAYPMDAIVTLGVHFQLTKRSGKTSQALRQEAKAIVYGTH